MNLLTFIDRAPDNSSLMPAWFYAVLAFCVVALTIALVIAVVATARMLRRSERVMAVVERELEQELPPLLADLRELSGELRLLSRGATAELARIEQITGRVQEVAEGASSLLNALSGLTRVGQLVGIVAGLKTGVDVFVHRWRQRGDGYA
jgi:hypothetical protein